MGLLFLYFWTSQAIRRAAVSGPKWVVGRRSRSSAQTSAWRRMQESKNAPGLMARTGASACDREQQAHVQVASARCLLSVLLDS